ncbi:hypothetical protein GNI_199050 [Gregarina niphandrodes]|uniref:Uncharacterized protein n=1 Tax=Gregarina niphandrodes TaxID=110365 RepID=A0A023AXI6_GRENI|nr:hypothetical protein GNI_199050 [Gregarina niphandrodes]EZG42995.1 hypothetical protein GNI_199050 [Gregarina niphandrodes]|eukprot:XP_011133732.1 hypothetical protein GNI_199050 [Gregarina niphandrodes]
MPSESRSIRSSPASDPSPVRRHHYTTATTTDEELKSLLKASNTLQQKIAVLLQAKNEDRQGPKIMPERGLKIRPDDNDSDNSSSDDDDKSDSDDSLKSDESSSSSHSSRRSSVARSPRTSRHSRTQSHDDHHVTRRLIKELNIKESFYPRHEKAYDDQLDLLERLTRAKGFDVNRLSQVIMSVADDNVLYRINKKKIYGVKEWQAFRDQLAKELYPYSNEIDVVAQDLSEVEEREDAEDLVIWFEKTVQRYHMLRRPETSSIE